MKLTAGTRVVLDMTTLTIMRALPREVFYHLFSNYKFHSSGLSEKQELFDYIMMTESEKC